MWEEGGVGGGGLDRSCQCLCLGRQPADARLNFTERERGESRLGGGTLRFTFVQRVQPDLYLHGRVLTLRSVNVSIKNKDASINTVGGMCRVIVDQFRIATNPGHTTATPVCQSNSHDRFVIFTLTLQLVMRPG